MVTSKMANVTIGVPAAARSTSRPASSGCNNVNAVAMPSRHMLAVVETQ
jgi:hypothetical protein